MNKREVVWLIVRLIGLYFVYLALVTLFSLASAGSTLYSLSSHGSNVKPEIENIRVAPVPVSPRTESEVQVSNKTDPATEKLKSEEFKTLLLYIFLTGIYGVLGIYLIKKGRILFDILNNEDSTNRQEDNPAVTTLKL